MQKKLLDYITPLPDKDTKAIDKLFKIYVIFFTSILVIYFFLSLLNTPIPDIILIAQIAFLFFYSVFPFLFGIGRGLINLINSFFILSFSAGLVGCFQNQSYHLITLIFVPPPLIIQLVYELIVRKERSKFLYIFSVIGISLFSIGILLTLSTEEHGGTWLLENWPFETEVLTLKIGAIITIVMTIIHLDFVRRNPREYQIHIRYLTQCIFALIIATMLWIFNK